MRGIVKPEHFGRTAFVALAALALAMLTLVPPGYMIAGGANASPTRIVICTGHGPVLTAVDLGKTAPTKSRKAGGPCAFAAHVSAAPLSAQPVTAAAWPLSLASSAPLASQVAIGRGLAAPPPARAPPIAL